MKPEIAAIVLAAGLGTRMRSERAKVLHELGGEPMIARTLRAIMPMGPHPLALVVGHQARDVEAAARASFPEAEFAFAIQKEQRGTGDAARCGLRALPADFAGEVLIIYGDVPMLSSATLMEFAKAHRARRSKLSFITVKLADGGAYGRVVRDGGGEVSAIVEARDASPTELTIREINTGVYLADAALLRELLAGLKADNAQHEYYLTDIVALAKRGGAGVFGWCASDPAEFANINSREELASMEAQIRETVNRKLMAAGVTFVD